MFKELVIDDLRNLTDYVGHDIHYARNLEEARLKLFNEEWDAVWLDNDLGGNEEVITLVNEIERLFHEEGKILPVEQFVIHTQNVVAGDRMEEAFHHLPYMFFRVTGDRKNFYFKA